MPDVPKESPYSEAAHWVFRIVEAAQEGKLFDTPWAKLPCDNSKLYYGYIVCIYNSYQIFLCIGSDINPLKRMLKTLSMILAQWFLGYP